jgi:phosphatidylglycerophosphate synthase
MSASRFITSLAFLFLITDPAETLRRESCYVAVVIFASDLADGFLARFWRVTSKLGYILDGVADRASYIAFTLALCSIYHVRWELIYLVILRDVLLYALRATTPDWYKIANDTRMVTKAYAICFKAFVIIFLGIFYLRAYGAPGLQALQSSTLDRYVTWAFWASIPFSYLSLWAILRRYYTSFPEEFQS